MFENPDAAARCAMLKKVRTIAVVGLSPNAARPSYGVAKAMQDYGFRVIPVHPAAQEILGEKVYPTLADIPHPVDLVDVFRSAEFIDGVVDECLALGLKAIWIQEGIVNEAAAARAQAGGMMVVMDRCVYRDYRDYCR
ncbi:MAG: CoA-binding protein [Betaproteobacteria bacterium]|nr:MAG: CoA-binding protein [Betaproteobacteria bacterium]